MTDQRITPFLFEGEYTIREVSLNGDPWFFVTDICAALSLGNVTMAIANLDDDEKSTFSLTEGGPERLIVNESGLYTIILRSRNAVKQGTVAHRFRKWVTSEVLPSIRQTGGYSAAKEEAPMRDEQIQMQDGLKLRKVGLAHRLFGERAGQQMWRKVDLEWVPAMASVFSQGDMFDGPMPTGSVTITVAPSDHRTA